MLHSDIAIFVLKGDVKLQLTNITMTYHKYNVMLLLGNVYEKAYEIPSHLRASSFFAAVCLKVGRNFVS